MDRYVVLRRDSSANKGLGGDEDNLLRSIDAPVGADDGGGAGGYDLESFEADAADVEPVDATVEAGTFAASEVAELKEDPDVVAAVPVMPLRLLEPTTSDNDAGATDSWGIDAVGAGQSTFSGKGVTVAVLDTGIDASHPAFAGMKLVSEDFTGTGNGDGNGHGTHCAGTIFGRDVAGRRIGVARGIDRALIGKVLNANGGGDSAGLFNALLWANTNGANIISMSLGFDFPGMVAKSVSAGMPVALATSKALDAYRANVRMFDAIMQLIGRSAPFGRGALVVAATGNESRVNLNKDYRISCSVPAVAEDVVSVGALEGPAGPLAVADFSNGFPVLCAPGVNIVSAGPANGLTSKSGTSMATPHVAGVAALWWEKLRGLGGANADLVQSYLIANARDAAVNPKYGRAERGAGLVQAP